jgi:hypothetical protein
MSDLKSGLRQFLHKPLFSVLAVLLLAIGIGRECSHLRLYRRPC